jgi:ribosomal protein S15P/S13E
MRKAIILTGAAFAVLSLVTAALANEALMKDFVSFDRAFIPPLALTNQEKVNPSKKAMMLLKENWSAFKGKHFEANPKDTQWKTDLDKVESSIRDAGRIIEGGKNLMEAHEILEQVRFVFMALRKRNNIDYYVDHLSEFHEHMEAIIHTASERDAGSLSSKDKEFMGKEFAQASLIWERIQALRFDAALFGFNDQKLAEMKDLVKKEADALQKLRSALGGNDNAVIIQSAKGIRPNYANLYKMFGDFDRVSGGAS